MPEVLPVPQLNPKTYSAGTPCMAKLDRLRWQAGMAVSSFGVRVGVRTNDEQYLSMLRDRLPPGWKPAASAGVERMFSFVGGGSGPNARVRRYHMGYEDFGLVARTFELDEALDLLQSSLRRYVAEFARHRVFVHAGVVGWRGKAILIPGRSHSGKSTLVAELVRAGATYYSDEYAVLDSRGRVHPFTKPLSLRSGPNAGQRNIPIEKFGGQPGTKPLPAGLIVFSGYKPNARWRPQSLSVGQAVLKLLSNTIAARRIPTVAIKTLNQVAVRASVIKSNRGEARDAAQAILAFST